MFAIQRSLVLVMGYVNLDYASDLCDKRTTTGYVLRLSSGPICWRSMLQLITTISTTKAQYMVVTDATKEALCIKWLIKKVAL